MRSITRMLVVVGAAGALTVPLCAQAVASPPENQGGQVEGNPQGTNPSTTPAQPDGPTSSGTSTGYPASQPTEASDSCGLAPLVRQALSQANLKADQSDQVQGLMTRLSNAIDPLKQAKAQFLIALAHAVESNHVDAQELAQQQAKVADAAAQASPAVRTAFEQLHSLLDPAQRDKFVTALADEINKSAKADTPQVRLDRLAQMLDLNDQQKAQAKSILSDYRVDREVRLARINLVLTAFLGDKFDMKDLVPANAARDCVAHALERTVQASKQMSEVLTPKQRSKAADFLRGIASQISPSSPATGTSQSAHVGQSEKASTQGSGSSPSGGHCEAAHDFDVL